MRDSLTLCLALFVTAPGGLEAAFLEAVTALPISQGILFDDPADCTAVLQQNPLTDVCQRMSRWSALLTIVNPHPMLSTTLQDSLQTPTSWNIEWEITLFSRARV